MDQLNILSLAKNFVFFEHFLAEYFFYGNKLVWKFFVMKNDM